MKKFFNVFGSKIKVNYIDLDEETKDLMGWTTRSPIEIFVNKNMSAHDIKLSILHECFHAVMFRVGLDQVIEESVQEILCESFADFVHNNFIEKKR